MRLDLDTEKCECDRRKQWGRQDQTLVSSRAKSEMNVVEVKLPQKRNILEEYMANCESEIGQIKVSLKIVESVCNPANT